MGRESKHAWLKEWEGGRAGGGEGIEEKLWMEMGKEIEG